MGVNKNQSLQNNVKRSLPDKAELSLAKQLHVVREDGSRVPFDYSRLLASIQWASRGYEEVISVEIIAQESLRNMFDGICSQDISEALALATVAFIEDDPAYSKIASRFLRKALFRSVTRDSITSIYAEQRYRDSFIVAIDRGIQGGVLDERLAAFDLNRLADALVPERDELFEYMGLRTLHERYLLQRNGNHWELPQVFWMRVAMGVALREKNATDWAIAFYHTISTLRYVPSTPTLLHSGLVRAQLSSCFLGTVKDDLKHIFKCLGDNAQLSKWSGGVAYDWSNIRATGSLIQSINVESQGLIPFLKISNDVTAAINRSGKRRSASCVYVETWHLDVEDFLDLRRNTGDERRRTHDINTANWVPDLFMKRVIQDGPWTLFSPEEVSDLHDLYGVQFEKRYQEYEREAQKGMIKKYKVVEATKLWRKMISRLFETGHPWITFKDPCNVRSPQDHVGVVHSSNLCTEITLNTSAEETAVCNLGSINLAQHVIDGQLDTERIGQTVKVAMRMLDNVIDINFYPTEEARVANMRHRPVGLGVMGFQDALFLTDMTFDDEQAPAFASKVQEIISYHTILASSHLAKEHGAYQSYTGSKWDRGIFPRDTIALLEKERGSTINVVAESLLDWNPVYEHVKRYGMRNSNTMAIAPTATISNIAGCFPCTEPMYKNLYVKANMSGEFTIINKYLVDDLKAHGLWSHEMKEKLKYFDGSIQMIQEIPEAIRCKHKEAFEYDPAHLVDIAASRGVWIDQSQSHNVFMKGVSGQKIHEIYMRAWNSGLKTTYYLRTLGATQIEKSTLDAKKYGYTQMRQYMTDASGDAANLAQNKQGTQLCRIDDSECEACQ